MKDYDPGLLKFIPQGELLNETRDRIRDARISRLVTRHAEAQAKAKEYTNFVIVAGYAAFFALWSGVASDLPSQPRCASAALIGVSLLVFIGWEITTMVARDAADRPFDDICYDVYPTDDFEGRWERAAAAAARIHNRYRKAWPWVLGVSIVTGLGGAAILTGTAAAKGLGL